MEGESGTWKQVDSISVSKREFPVCKIVDVTSCPLPSKLTSFSISFSATHLHHVWDHAVAVPAMIDERVAGIVVVILACRTRGGKHGDTRREEECRDPQDVER